MKHTSTPTPPPGDGTGFLLTIRPEPAGTDRLGRCPTKRLKLLCKTMLRLYGWRIVEGPAAAGRRRRGWAVSERTPGSTPGSETLNDLAAELGVDAAALAELGVERNGKAWRIPEYDASGERIGTATRHDDGSKRCAKGSRRGLTLCWPLPPYAGSSERDPVLVVEGMSDAAAGRTLGFDTVGRPSAAGGFDLLAELLADRHAAVIGERDDGVGMSSARELAERLAGVCPSVKLVLPPEGVKDLRAWLGAGLTREGLLAVLGAAERVVVAEHDAAEVPRSAPRLIRMSDVEPAEVRWLWPGRVPLGRMTLLVGRPGEGKSFLTADMAARVSRGRPWPDGSPCPVPAGGSVVLCSAEDDPADTLAPRLMAHDADRSRVHLLAGVSTRGDDGKQVDRVFTLADLDVLRAALRTLEDVRLIVVDPIGSYMGGRTDTHRDNEVRAVLAPAAALAAEHDAALLVVAHTRKSAAAFADDMAMGSRGFTGLARSVLHLLTDPDDPSKRRRLLLPGKNNLAERPAGLAFTIGRPPDAVASAGACVQWLEGEVELTADEAVNREAAGDDDDERTTERDDAAAWLAEALADGPLSADEVRRLARGSYSLPTLKRAKKAAGIDSKKTGFGTGAVWWWCLPGQEPPAEADQAEHEGDEGDQGVDVEPLRQDVIPFADDAADAAGPRSALEAGR